MSDQFVAERKRLNARQDRFNRVSKLLSSTKKSDRQQAQRILKSMGRYDGPIDGNQGKGTTSALNAMRKSINNASSKLDLRVKQFNDNAARQRADKLAASKQKAKAEKQKAADEQRKSLIQTGVLATSVVAGLGYSAKSVKNLRKQDAVATKAINTELRRVNTQLEKTKNAKGAKLKSGQYSASTKKRLAVIANSAKKQNLTRYRMPIGGAKAVILAAESVGARVLAETTFKDNEMAKQTLHGVSTGLGIAALTTPLTRVADKHSTPHRLNAGHVAAIEEASSMGQTKPKASKKSAKSSAIKGAKAVGKKALKAVPIVGWAATAYFAGEAAYNTFSKTGSAAKAAEAGANNLTMGAYDAIKKSNNLPKSQKHILRTSNFKRLTKSQERSSQILKDLRADIKGNSKTTKTTTPAPKIKRVKAALSASKKQIKAGQKNVTSFKMSSKSNGYVKAHTRTINGKRVRVKSFKRAA